MFLSNTLHCLSSDLYLFSIQCHLYLFHTCQKKLKSFTLLTIIILCNAFLCDLRNIWQLAFHMSVACLSTLLTLHRKLLDRNMDCGVWLQLAVDNSRVRDQKMWRDGSRKLTLVFALAFLWSNVMFCLTWIVSAMAFLQGSSIPLMHIRNQVFNDILWM